jgi:hypothetical protein
MPIATPGMEDAYAQNATVSTMNPALINKGNLVTPDAVTAMLPVSTTPGCPWCC